MSSVSLPPPIWTESITLRSYDVDFRHLSTVEALCRYFLEAAWRHAEALGVGFAHLAAQDRFWVLSRLLVRVDRLPNWGENLTVSTWPRPIQSLFAMRHFELADSTGVPAVSGVSSWLVLHRKTRRPQRLDTLLGSLTQFPQREALKDDPGKLDGCPPAGQGFPITARFSDMDVNAHVNSARYLAWLLDSYPLEFHGEHLLDSLEVNFLSETRAGDSLTVYSRETGPGQFLHCIRKSGATDVCRAQLKWRTLAGAGFKSLGAAEGGDVPRSGETGEHN